MKVKAVMTATPTTCTPDTTVAEAANLMWESDCGVLPIVDDGELMGIVTDRDLFIAVGTRNTRAVHLRVGAVATTKVTTCAPDDEVETALATMKQARVRRLPVVDVDRKLIGILSLNDIVLAAGESGSVKDRDVVAALQGICAHPPRDTDQAAA